MQCAMHSSTFILVLMVVSQLSAAPSPNLYFGIDGTYGPIVRLGVDSYPFYWSPSLRVNPYGYYYKRYYYW
ncbi:hypothetical protein WA026_013138 [Henosepilachna vigintioctopunctata]|uniref:Uncharacterized protein n=1 Tax=Henosepilachna vigintioctopunctata TaxID=420089 RepID=A0AAW1UE58_9CUCU